MSGELLEPLACAHLSVIGHLIHEAQTQGVIHVVELRAEQRLMGVLARESVLNDAKNARREASAEGDFVQTHASLS